VPGVRVVLAVLLAVALFAVTAPALTDARATVTADRLAAERADLERAAGALAAGSTAVREGDPAPRRTVRLAVPGRSLSTVGVEYVAVGCPAAVLDGVDGEPAGCEPAFVFRVADGPPTVWRLRGPPLSTPRGPVVLDPGTHRLALRYVRGPAGPTVRVTRG